MVPTHTLSPFCPPRGRYFRGQGAIPWHPQIGSSFQAQFYTAGLETISFDWDFGLRSAWTPAWSFKALSFYKGGISRICWRFDVGWERSQGSLTILQPERLEDWNHLFQKQEDSGGIMSSLSSWASKGRCCGGSDCVGLGFGREIQGEDRHLKAPDVIYCHEISWDHQGNRCEDRRYLQNEIREKRRNQKMRQRRNSQWEGKPSSAAS